MHFICCSFVLTAFRAKLRKKAVTLPPNSPLYFTIIKTYTPSRLPEYRTFLAQHFEGKVQKISIDAGFTCPVRNGALGHGGCTYCNNRTFSPGYGGQAKSVTQQLEEGKQFFARKYPEMRYLAYFQSYTNTYDTVERLRALYEEALRVPDVVGIVIGTRPDCVSDELLDYLEELHHRTFLLVEYGIESTYDDTLLTIQRGHTYADTVDAITRTHERGIRVGGHLILGLPGDTKARIMAQAQRINALPLHSIKFHQLQIVRGTIMSGQWRKTPEMFDLFTPEAYIALVAEMVCHLRRDLVIERFTAQAPPDMLLAPRWGLKNFEFVHQLQKYLHEHDLWQGKALGEAWQ